MRIFVALDIEEEIRKRLQHFMEEMWQLASGARWVSPESLHVTLKFIGEKPEPAVKQIEEALGSINSEPFQVRFRGAGFFPTAKAARVFWAGIEGEAGLADLAAKVEESLAVVGVSEEQRDFSPHLTLARAGSRAGGGSGAPHWRKGDKVNQRFGQLQEKLAQSPAPDFGRMTAREFFLYRSQLSPKGSQYTKIARFGLYSRKP
jgi:RNA 2',3'-cyclic 3'-phosphodiesterase